MTTPQAKYTWRIKNEGKGGKTPLEEINRNAIIITLGQRPGRSHVFIRANRIIVWLYDKSAAEYEEHDFYISAKRPHVSTADIWNWTKGHQSKPMFWLLHQFEEFGTWGGLHEIDPTPIKNFQKDFNDEKIMWMALNPKYPSTASLPYQIACRCQCCAKVFVATDKRQRFCAPECRIVYHNIARKIKAKKEKRSRFEELGTWEGLHDPRCVVCGGVLNGRSDAKTCGDQCRQKKHRAEKKSIL